MHLQDQGIENCDGVNGRVRRARGLSNDNGGVRRGRQIYDVSKGSETQILQQQQQRRWRRVEEESKGLERTTEAVLDRKQARWIGNDNGVLIFLAIGLLPVTLSSMCLFAVSF